MKGSIEAEDGRIIHFEYKMRKMVIEENGAIMDMDEIKMQRFLDEPDCYFYGLTGQIG